MKINLAVDDSLIRDAVKLGRHKTKRIAVNAAPEEYVKARKRLEILDMFGKVDFGRSWDFKEVRRLGNKRVPKG